MNARLCIAILSTAALSIPAGAQMQRRAVMVGGGNASQGRCTGQVVVDGSADLQIQGDTASVRDLRGSQPQIQRFECTSAMPAGVNPRVNVSGRGQAQVVATPANGGPEVIRIQDSEGGASVYQFDVSWTTGGNGNPNGQPYNQGYNNPGYNNNGYNNPGYQPPVAERRDGDRDHDRGWNGGGSRFTSAQAINVCRDAIREQAMEQYGARDVNFGRIRMDDNPGRNDWVVGTVGVRRGYTERQLPFSCSVNFDTGRVRSAQITAPASQGYAGRDSEARAMDKCRAAVANRIGGRVDPDDMTMDPDGDLVRGSAWARGRSVDFTCRVSPYDGDVRSVNISPRNR